MGKFLSRDAILKTQDIATEEVEVPEWGGSVLVKAWTGAERDAFEASIVEGKGKKMTVNMHDLRAKVVAGHIVDESGEHIFTSGDVLALSGKSASALNRIFVVAQRLSGLSDEDMEELAKNSESGQSDGSGLT
jgi:hypothetical protein